MKLRGLNPFHRRFSVRGSSIAWLWVGVALLLSASLVQAGPYDTWAKYKTLTINTTSSSGGANITATLTSYPMLIRLSTANADDILGEALSGGADVRFTTSDGSTALSYQIERWTSTAAEIWVLIPTLTGNSTTDIRIYWGKSGQTTTSSGSTVFSTGNNFVAVWHLAEDGGTTSGAYKDATGNASNGTGVAMTNSNDVSTVIGIGSDFNGSSQYITTTSSTNSGTRTLSAWIYPNTSPDVSFIQSIIDGDVGGEFGQILGIDNGYVSCGLDNQFWATGKAISINTWQLVTLTFNATQAKLFYNGDSAAVLNYTRGAVTNTTYQLGKSKPNAEYFDGGVDEIRIIEGTPSNSWFKMDYQSQKATATCVSFGPTVASTYYWNRNSVISSSTDFSKSYNWYVNANGTGRRPVSTTDDDFTSDTKAAAWTMYDADGYSDTQSPYYSLTDNADQFTLRGRGADVYQATNEFVAAYRSDITGDFDVSVKLLSQSNADQWSKAGIMMADNINTLSNGGYAALSVTPSFGFHFQPDAAGNVGELDDGASTGSVTFPCWLRLVKSGSSVSAYYRTSSTAAWTQVGTAQTIQSTATNSEIALFLTSHDATESSTAVFDEFQGGTTVSPTDKALSFAGTGSGADANATMTAAQAAASIDFTGYTGTFNFSSYTLTANTGNVTFASGQTVTAGTGTLAFTASSGTQVLTPKSGGTHPNITHTGAGTLQLSTNALSCLSFSQSAGVLDFNSVNITTTSSGDFTITNGTSSSISNLNGRTITVAGDASFTGQNGDLLNLNASAWDITVTGMLTADYANIGGSDASGGSEGDADDCTDAGDNSNWDFGTFATSSFSRSVRFNFNTTSSGADVSGNVTNIPILIRLDTSNTDFSLTTATGTDILFVDKDGTALYHQVVEWDKANEVGKVWVKVPQVDGNSLTDYVTMYYGCESCLLNVKEVSDSVFTGFKSVFHMNAPESQAFDATALANHGAYAANLPLTTGLTTKNAAYFDGTSTSYINVPSESNYDMTSDLSVWAWIKVTTFDAGWQAIVTKGDNAWRLQRAGSTNTLHFVCTKSSTGYTATGSVDVNDGEWHHVVGTYDGSNVKLYVDGVQDGSSTALTGSLDNTSSSVYIGENVGATGRNWFGTMGEVRIGNTSGVLSSDFIKLSYENQKSSSTLFSSTTFTTASFQNSKVFKFNTTASGANVSGDVSNFPLLLRITGSTICDAVQSGAPDIRFLDADGVTWLDYQIERWSQSLDSAEVWVKVPKVDGNSASDYITMYYQQASGVSIPDGQCASCVFDPANGFTAVWHLDEAGNNTAANYNDATGNSNHGTGVSLVAGSSASALAGKGLVLDGTADYMVTTATPTLASVPLTLSGWAYRTDATGSTSDFMLGQGTGSTGNGLHFGYRSSNTFTFSFYFDDMNTTTTFSTPNSWEYWVGTFDPTTKSRKIFYNGVLDKSGTSSGQYSGSGVVRVGNGTFGSDFFPGVLDEVNISTIVRSDDWIKLSYQTQRRDAAPFFNPSPSDFNSTQKYTFNTTKTGANISDSVTNFPLLVRITGSTIVDAVQNDYDDIRFLDGDGVTWLQYQVERWNKTQDSAEVWVLVPKVDGNSDRDFITLYYNDVTDGAVVNGQCATCVFDTANSFTAVWHLENTNDATANAWNLTVTGGSGGAVTGGITGRSYDFNNNGLISTASAMDPPNSGGTMSMWMYVDAFATTDRPVGGDGDFEYRLDASGNLNIDHFGDGPRARTPLTSGVWRYVTTTWSSSTGPVRLYLDGAIDSVSTTVSGSDPLTDAFSLGSRTGTTDYYDGRLDEVRLCKTVRSADWIKLNYETQRASGNVFWNSRAGPNNKVTLTASTTSTSNISLTWNSTVSDSTNADSVGIWVKYSAYPDSANAASTTVVARLAKTDTTYSYPANYPGTYYFALAVRNSNGKWSPFTKTSSDTAVFVGSSLPDTIYVDSARGSDANSCASSQNPATPKLTITSALTCGASASDTLVVRVMPGTYTSDNAFAVTSSKPSVVTSFDNVTRAVLAGNGSATDYATWNFAVSLSNYMTLRRMDVRTNATTNSEAGIYVRSDVDSVVITGNRIYGTSSYAFEWAIVIPAGDCEGILVSNNLIHQPSSTGIHIESDDRTNIMNNVFYGSGGTTKGINMPISAYSTGFFTITNNIFYNWNYGIYTADSDNEIGTVSNNLFYNVTSGQEVTGETDANKVIKDPLFASTTLLQPNAFKLLPGSPAIDAGTATINGGANAWPRTAPNDYFGTSRYTGSAPDIGLYEGTGYTQNATGDFDTLTTTTSGNTVIVKNSKWKVIFDMARGGGINFFSDMSDSGTNLLASSSLLFDVTVDSYVASSQTSNTIKPSIVYQSKTMTQVLQRLAVSASLDLYVYYSIYASGHIYVQSELINLTTGSVSVGTYTFKGKVGTATDAYSSSTGASGFGYLTTSTRDVFIGTTQALDSSASAAETWAMSSASGASGYVQWTTANLADPAGKFKRVNTFLIHLGESSLGYNKSALLHADANKPSDVSVYSGSPLHVHSWQSQLMGHWSFDEGGGSTLRDNSVYKTNHGTPTSLTYVTGVIGAAGSFTTTSEVSVADNSTLEAQNYFTLAFWIYPVSASITGSTPYAIWKGTSSSDGFQVQKVSGQNQWTFTMGNGNVTVSIPDATWSHLVFVVVSGQIYAYVNGTLLAAGTNNVTATANASALIFGDATGGDKFYGKLDDIRLYANWISSEEVQAIYRQGFARKDGAYHLRANNNNRVVAMLNTAAPATRFQPAFLIDNWYSSATPKYVYIDGTRLKPNVDFVSSLQSLNFSGMGDRLCIQLNKTVTSQNANLFIDDDDSTGYQGVSSLAPKLTMSSTAGDKITIKNFSDTVFGASTSRQWYLELDLDGGTAWGGYDSSSNGFGGFNVWKAAAISPALAISSASNLAVTDKAGGTNLMQMKLDNTGGRMFSGGAGHALPTTYTYTITDSSAVRLSLVLSNTSLQSSDGTATLNKRWTVYPNGRIFANFVISAASFSFDQPRFDFIAKTTSSDSATWSTATALSSARTGLYRGTSSLHSFAGALLSIKSAGATTTSGASNLSSVTHTLNNAQGYSRLEMYGQTGLFQSGDVTISANFVMDISRDFTDSATADSLMADLQSPATITAITGTAVTNDALDYNTDGFAEGDGAYVFQANSSGIAEFTFTTTVPHFSPAFRITNWSQGTLPDYVFINNQAQNRGYDYNAYIDVANSTLVLQFNKTLSGNTKTIYISHKSGLAVTLQQLSAVGGPGVDTVSWVTQSELNNLGYHVWRRIHGYRMGDKINVSTLNGNLDAAKINEGEIYVATSARMAADIRGGTGAEGDTVPQLKVTADQLYGAGWIRLTVQLIPGAPEGNSSSRREYHYIDNKVEPNTVYDYVLEAIDNETKSSFFGSVQASPEESLVTGLQGAFPNPFNPVTTLRFSLATPQKVSLLIYNAKGQLVRTLVRPDKPLKPGRYRLYWDARTDQGMAAASGPYFYQFKTPNYIATKKMILLK